MNMLVDVLTNSKLAEANPVKNLDSDDIAQNKVAHLRKQQNGEDEHTRLLSYVYAAAFETKALSWVAALLFSAGSFSDLFLESSYITDNGIVAAGSVLWMLYAFGNRNYPMLFQHSIIFAISLYMFIKHLTVGKFAYLIAALLCTSCAVYRHENLMNGNRDLCSNVSNIVSNNMISMPANPHPPICELENLSEVLDEKVAIIDRLQKKLVGLASDRGVDIALENDKYAAMYISARKRIMEVLNQLQKQKLPCPTPR